MVTPTTPRASGSMLKRAWRACIGWPAFYFVVLLLGLVEIGWLIPAIVIRLVVSEERGKRIGRRVIATVFRYYFHLTKFFGVMEVDATALDAIDPAEAMIIVPNHPTGLDALILVSRLENLNCIMKASTLDNLLLGSGARLAGYIRNDGPRRLFRLATDDLRNGGQLIIFPEATRTLAAPVNAFKGGFAAMARVARVPVQTVIVETNTPFLSKGWSVLRKPPDLPMVFHVRPGRRFDVPEDGDLGPFVDDVRAYFVDALAGAPLGRLWDVPRPACDASPAPEARLSPREPGRDDPRGEAPASAIASLTSR